MFRLSRAAKLNTKKLRTAEQNCYFWFHVAAVIPILLSLGFLGVITLIWEVLWREINSSSECTTSS